MSSLRAVNLQVAVTPQFAGESLVTDSLRYTNASGEAFSFTRLSYLLTDFAVQKPDGSWVEVLEQAAWLDWEKERSTLTLTNLPAGEYRSLRFHLGPDALANHTNIALLPADHPLNPNLNGLHWSWQSGYIFLALEGHFLPPATNVAIIQAREGWSFHLANDPNRTRLTLAVPLVLTNDARLELAFDLGTLLRVPRAISFTRDGSSTHSRPGDPIAAALVANLPGAFRFQRLQSLAPTATAVAPAPRDLPAVFTPYRFEMSGFFPLPALPTDNPLIEERVALGRALFHDTALSRDGTVSCASCHETRHAFSDARRFSRGVEGRTGHRQAMPLFNLAWKNSFFWDGRSPTLRDQALRPIQDHQEMDENLTNVVAKLTAPPSKTGTNQNYPALFAAAFGSSGITSEKIGLALEQFLLTLTSYDSKFDRTLRGQETFNDQEKRGFELFMTEYDPRREQFGADCFHCHGGPLFQSQSFANNGLDATPVDLGRYLATGKKSDVGKFATPSLRNVALTAPYMHDGRFTNLTQVVKHYAGGLERSATLDPNLAKHPVGGLPLNDADVQALVAFLETLTDEKFRTR